MEDGVLHTLGKDTGKGLPMFSLNVCLHEEDRTHLDGPEVTRQQQDDGDHAGDEAAAHKLTEQVGQDGAHTKEQVKEGRHWVPGNSYMNIGMVTLISCGLFILN